MKAEEAKKLADEALANLATALEQGKSDAMKSYLAAMGRFHRYSFGNIMLIVSQKQDATRVAGFQTWKEFGRFVRKGEKGIVIIAPMVIHAKGNDKEDTGSDADDRTILRFRAVYVFDVSQTEGESLPEPVRAGGNPNGHTERLKAFISEKGIILEFVESLGSADGVSTGGKIRLRDGLAPAEEFSVLVHELAHEMMHHGEHDVRPSKTVRETEAEAVAFVVSQAIGLDVQTAASDYIQLYAGDTKTLAASLDRIQRTATAILDAVAVEA